jgi:hypothetical protein
MSTTIVLSSDSTSTSRLSATASGAISVSAVLTGGATGGGGLATGGEAHPRIHAPKTKALNRRIRKE